MAGKRANNTGSLRRRADRKKGKIWEAQIYSNGQKLSRSFVTQQEGQRWLDANLPSVRDGLDLDKSKILFSEAIDEWLKDNHEGWAASTSREYRRAVEKNILPRLPNHLKLRDARPALFDELFKTLKKEALGARSRQLARSVLHKFFADCMEPVGLPQNPIEKVTVKYRPKPMHPLNKEQSQRFLEKTSISPYAGLFLLALKTGMRQGEIIGLTWDHVLWKENAIEVFQQLQWEEKEAELGPTKTKTSKRRLPLSPDCMRMLREEKEAREAELAKDPPSATEWRRSLVFLNPDDEPVHARALLKELKRVLSAAKLPDIRFHDLRHTHATLMLLAGVNPKVVSERLGHASVRITLDLYSHVLPTLQEDAISKFDALFDDGGRSAKSNPTTD
jgi:integrase